MKEIVALLDFLLNVGYTSPAARASLSGGESQRIRLTQIGSSLMGVLYIDEPSIAFTSGQQKAAGHLKGLRDLGNTLLVVEHDEDTMFADWIVDIGPGAASTAAR